MPRNPHLEGVALLFQQMSNDDVVDILGIYQLESVNVTSIWWNKVLKMISKQCYNYAPDTAGGIMTTEYITVKEHLTVEENII